MTTHLQPLQTIHFMAQLHLFINIQCFRSSTKKNTNTNVKTLSGEFTEIPFQLPVSVCPPLLAEVTEIMIASGTNLHADQEWLENPSEISSWAAFHAQREDHLNTFKEDRSALLLIWQDD